VGVDVRHGLARLRAGVEDHPVALAADALGHRYLVSLANDLVQQAGVGGRERGDVRVVLLRDHEHVRRRLRVDVAEREHPVGSQDPGGRDRLGGDSAEQAFRHTKILGPRRYAWRLATLLSQESTGMGSLWAPYGQSCEHGYGLLAKPDKRASVDNMIIVIDTPE
jgi:hypothetical protein